MAHIVEKVIEQGEIILHCSEKDFQKKVRKENLLFDDNEIIIMAYLTSDLRYRDFARVADEMLTKVLSESRESYDIAGSIPEYKVFLNGFIPIMIFGIMGGDEKSFVSDMRYSRIYMKLLFGNV